jgi:hypothetical protein
MNTLWRTILRTRLLASITVHRQPMRRGVGVGQVVNPWNGPVLTSNLPVAAKPYFHVLFRAECAEPWMTSEDSVIPKKPTDWLADRGFGDMEHFDVKVGVAPPGVDARI